ncbi:endo alpha-1,4 polygalactosaminidase [Streptomyces fuscichromogenes]|uniref:endo alpha-1,4 polygalactosaminidase n=1 Tax=Streptomyces fuscichromogenes TaxID=1324013 RepID=UPI0038003C97
MPRHNTVPFHRRKSIAAAAAVGVVAVIGAGLVFSDAFAAGPATAAKPVLPKANARFDYQIGAPYAPASGVKVISRDRSAKPAKGLYNICYVNAFQAQPDALGWWQKNHPSLILKDKKNRTVMDKDWGEAVLDTSTTAKRKELAAVVGQWIDGCAKSGFQAVEPDNLDSYERSEGLLTKADNSAFAKLLVQRAHAKGLAIGQKNTAEMLSEHTETGFDFAVAEECAEYDECGSYAKAYNNRVYVIEYEDGGFDKACSRWGKSLSIVQRDVDVTDPGSDDYVFRTC